MKLILLSMLLVGLVSCSAKKTETDVDEVDAGIELSDSDELMDEGVDDIVMENTDELAAEDEAMASTEEPAEGEMMDEAPMEDMAVNEDAAPMMDEAPVAAAPANDIVIDETGGMKEYTVGKDETLMIVAFKIYGDYSKWREIAKLNQSVVSNGQNISSGTTLKYYAPSQAFNWSPAGNPYLIKTGDSLGSISTDTYGTMKYWTNIWNNNKPLIKDPNKIYAGFTIYTPVIEGRDVATN